MNNFFKILGLQISFVEHVDTHGGSIRVHIQEENFTFSNSLNEFLKREIEFGIKNHDTYLSFAKKIEDSKKIVLDNLFKLKKRLIIYNVNLTLIINK